MNHIKDEIAGQSQNVDNYKERIMELYNAGYSVLPIAEGTKMPHSAIKKGRNLNKIIATSEEVTEWQKLDTKSLGIYCGAVSQNLFTLDFDDKNYAGFFNKFYSEATVEVQEFFDKCHWTKTINNGYHIRYKTLAHLSA